MADGGNWVTKYGVPSLILSVAVFAFQQQQQVFDRLQANTESGYQFYSQNRTSLLYIDDYDRELSLLDVTGRAFPAVFCDVRLDMIARAGKAHARDGEAPGPEGQRPMTNEALLALREQLVAPNYDRPFARTPAQNAFESWLPGPRRDEFGRRGTPCPELPTQQIADGRDAADVEALTEEAPSEAAPAAPDRSAPRAGQTASSAQTGQAARTTPPTAPRNLRLFVHVVEGGAQEREMLGIMENARSALTDANFRVIRGIERIPQERFARNPVVRYFGPEERETAEQLAAYLSYLYRDQNLQFHASAIGERYPTMPHDNFEIWIPNPR
jgi:hypothetical protein